jgi:hypothetical protein
MIEVSVSIFMGHTLWQESAFEHPAPKCVLYSFTAWIGFSADCVRIK